MMVRHSLPASRRNAFTLLEILIVVAIIVVVAGIGGAYLFGALERGKQSTAKAQIKQLESQIESFRVQNQRAPESLQELLVPDQSSGLPYIKDPNAIIDPWGNPYQYEYSDMMGPTIWCQPPTGQVISNKPQGMQNQFGP